MDELTLTQMFVNSRGAWAATSHFVVMLFGGVGVWLALIAVLNYKNHADGKCSAAKPIVQTILAAAMVGASRFIPIIGATLVGEGANFTPWLSAVPKTDPLAIGMAISSVVLFVQMLGTIAAFRGFLMVYEATNKHEGAGVLGRAWTHILGGVLAVNLPLTIQIFAATFYPGLDLSFLNL